jgi:hypothetical protein
VIEIHGGFVRWFLCSGFILVPAAAMTIGHVVLGRDTECLDRSRDHEHVAIRDDPAEQFLLPARSASKGLMIQSPLLALFEVARGD